MRSEDVDLLNKEIRRLKKIECEKKRLPVKNATVCSKRKSIKKKTWSPDQPSTARKQIKLDKQIKKGKTLRKNKHTKSISTDSSNTESLNTSVDDQDYDTNISTVFINTQETVKNSTDKSKINSSPTKEELKEIASKYYELLKKQQAIDVNVSYIDITKDSQLPETKENVEENENIIQNDDTNKENEETYSTNDSNLNDHIEVDQNEDNDDQLLGHDYAGDKMIYLQNGIYCKKRIYDYAVGSSHRASHMARKLLGVFKKDALLQCTFTGQTPRSLNKECKMQNVSCLHDIAKHAIIDFSREMAKKRGWERQSKEKVKQAMSQRLGELKRDRRNAVMQEREINA